MSEIKYRLAAGTHDGLVRKNNEDNFVVCPDLSNTEWMIPQVSEYADLGEFGTLLVVADGMGGHNAGEVASAIAVDTIQQAFIPENLKDVVADDKAIQKFMVDAVKAADLNIFNRAKTDSSTQGMGTTIVMAWILKDKVYVCWCGDSRCYMLNREKGLVRLSKDHSYVQELVDRGELEPQYAMDHPLSNIITRCLGDMERRAVPDIRVFQLHDGDIILLCTDGLCGFCTDEQILDLLIKYQDNPEECKNELIAVALGEGGHDNVTVALCHIQIGADTDNDVGEDDSEKNVEDSEETGDSVDKPVVDTDLQKTQPTALPVSHPHQKGSSCLWILLLLLIITAVVFIFVFKIWNPFNSDSNGKAETIVDTTAVIEKVDSAVVDTTNILDSLSTAVDDGSEKTNPVQDTSTAILPVIKHTNEKSDTAVMNVISDTLKITNNN